MNYKVLSLKDNFELFEKQETICDAAWPDFMLHDPVANKHWMTFVEAYKECQLILVSPKEDDLKEDLENNLKKSYSDDEILAVITTVPIFFDKDLKELPEEGWDWGVEKTIDDLKKGISPNMLMGLQIVVNKTHQGKGISTLAVKEMAALTKRMGFERLIIPVRPSGKPQYPLQNINNYIQWENDTGLPFDNWLRVHIKAGGKIVKVCHRAMDIPGTIDQWEEWSKMEFKESGNYIIPGALNPVEIDLENDLGSYIEPNVWVVHNV